MEAPRREKAVPRTITAIEIGKRRQAQAKVFLDGAFAFSLSLPLVQAAALEPGRTLSAAEVERLKREDLLNRSLESALRLLGYRPRSEAELRSKLRKRFDSLTVERTLQRLKGQGLLDDQAFARFWRESRERFSPRSRRLIEFELRRKGVAAEAATEAASGLEDETSAYRAAEKKLRSLKNLDRQGFRRRLAAYLQRRGFNYEVIARTIDRMWQETVGAEANLDSDGQTSNDI